MIKACSCTSASGAGLGKRLFAMFEKWGSRRYARYVGDRKRAMFADLSGTVLEIGPGPGTNLGYYPRGIHYIAVEPNPYMHGYLLEKARGLEMEVDLRHGSAERLDLADGSVDVVVSTLVLCSVEDQDRVLGEIWRVLVPGGRFVFLEHVGAAPGTALRRLQRFSRPVVAWIGDGCRPDLDTRAAIERAGFEKLELEEFKLPIPVVGPHIAGMARKGAVKGLAGIGRSGLPAGPAS